MESFESLKHKLTYGVSFSTIEFFLHGFHALKCFYFTTMKKKLKNVFYFFKRQRKKRWVFLTQKSARIILSRYHIKLQFSNHISVKCSINISKSLHFLSSLPFLCSYTYFSNLSTLYNSGGQKRKHGSLKWFLSSLK